MFVPSDNHQISLLSDPSLIMYHAKSPISVKDIKYKNACIYLLTYQSKNYREDMKIKISGQKIQKGNISTGT